MKEVPVGEDMQSPRVETIIRMIADRFGSRGSRTVSIARANEPSSDGVTGLKLTYSPAGTDFKCGKKDRKCNKQWLVEVPL